MCSFSQSGSNCLHVGGGASVMPIVHDTMQSTKVTIHNCMQPTTRLLSEIFDGSLQLFNRRKVLDAKLNVATLCNCGDRWQRNSKNVKVPVERPCAKRFRLVDQQRSISQEIACLRRPWSFSTKSWSYVSYIKLRADLVSLQQVVLLLRVQAVPLSHRFHYDIICANQISLLTLLSPNSQSILKHQTEETEPRILQTIRIYL